MSGWKVGKAELKFYAKSGLYEYLSPQFQLGIECKNVAQGSCSLMDQVINLRTSKDSEGEFEDIFNVTSCF
jgi:hypothetical protein